MSVAGGDLDEQFPVGVDEQDSVVLPLDEQDPDRAGWGWMNSSPWSPVLWYAIPSR